MKSRVRRSYDWATFPQCAVGLDANCWACLSTQSWVPHGLISLDLQPVVSMQSQFGYRPYSVAMRCRGRHRTHHTYTPASRHITKRHHFSLPLTVEVGSSLLSYSVGAIQKELSFIMWTLEGLWMRREISMATRFRLVFGLDGTTALTGLSQTASSSEWPLMRQDIGNKS